MGEKTAPPLRIVSWNITLQCPLRCSHCYSDAGAWDVPDPLNTGEAFRILDQIRATGSPVVILSGGEPMMRDDLFAIASYGTGLGIRMALGTSGYLIDEETILRIKQAGIRAVAISLDAADPAVHDSVRGRQGAFQRAVRAIGLCVQHDIRVQINMTVFSPEPAVLDDLIHLGISLGVQDYQIFIPVPTGRSSEENYKRYGTYESFLKHILSNHLDSGISIRPTCIPQFRRIAEEMGITEHHWGRGCIAGISYCRIFANGDVTPCPYLPVIAGNLRLNTLSEIWEHSVVFRALRDADRLQGKCGACGYRHICGGCRARAFARYGKVASSCGALVHPMDIAGELCAEDPLCPYQPGDCNE
jgi:radical SAM protein with 4Fe4S-binding SPASM domain